MFGCSTPDPLTLRSSSQPAPFISPKAPTTQFRALTVPATVIRIETASSPKYDRVVFTFSGKTVPGYWFLSKNGAAPASSPAVFEMRLGARAAKQSVLKKGPLNYPVLKGLAQANSGEESVLWLATLSKDSDYRVIELTNPPRIIVDFKR